jgi:kinesin family protein 2/24
MSKIKIYTRIRPHVKQIYRMRPYQITAHEKDIYLLQERINIMNEKKVEKKRFGFDHVFDIDYTNEDIYNHIGKDLIDKFKKKKNCVFYVYGQTGSGKTYTLLGNDNNMGLLEMILSEMTIISDNIKYSGIQIYNGKCFDLFTNTMLKECEKSDGSIHFLNMINHSLPKNVNNVIKSIKESRYVGVSSSNNDSSRSHLIFQIINGDNYIQIVDLAGSERACESVKNKFSNMRENSDINLSILAIKECIRSMTMKKKIPYRNSKITKILKNTFTNRVHTYILSTITPLKKDIIDTRNTLKYMSEMKNVKQKVLPPVTENKRTMLNKLNINLNRELSKDKLEKTIVLNLIEQNIKSLKDLKSNLINI